MRKLRHRQFLEHYLSPSSKHIHVKHVQTTEVAKEYEGNKRQSDTFSMVCLQWLKSSEFSCMWGALSISTLTHSGVLFRELLRNSGCLQQEDLIIITFNKERRKFINCWTKGYLGNENYATKLWGCPLTFKILVCVLLSCIDSEIYLGTKSPLYFLLPILRPKSSSLSVHVRCLTWLPGFVSVRLGAVPVHIHASGELFHRL